MIDDTISSAKVYSAEVAGTDLVETGSQAQTTGVTAQVIPVADGDFEVDIEDAVVGRNGQYTFTPIGKFRNGDDALASNFPISLRCRYRFRHISGVACKVLLRG